MVQSSDPTAELADLLQNPVDLDFQLPDPEDEEIPEQEFLQRIDYAWLVCDRFDLQTEIWRGRILRAIRDREKQGGDGRGTGFLNWLKEREISKSQAYSWIQLANSADTLLTQGNLDPASIKNFSKRAFVETAKASPEVQQLVTEAAQKGDRITRREVRQLTDEWTAMSSDLLPDEVKAKAADHSVPPRYLTPLVKEFEKLPEKHLAILQEEVAENPNVETLKQVTSEAKSLARYIESAAQVRALNQEALDVEMALEEALRVGCLSTAADLLRQATQLEQAVVKFFLSWKRLGNLADRLYVDTGVTTPNLRSLLTCLERLSNDVIEVPVDDAGDLTVRLKITAEAAAVDSF